MRMTCIVQVMDENETKITGTDFIGNIKTEGGSRSTYKVYIMYSYC